jgi:hypothetical protein
MVLGGAGGSDGEETADKESDTLAAYMSEVIEHAQVNNMYATPVGESEIRCEFCNMKHDKFSCFLWLSTDPRHRVFLYYRILRTDRRFLEQVCSHGISKRTIPKCPLPGKVIKGSPNKTTPGLGPDLGDQTNTIVWGPELTQQVMDYASQPEWTDIEPCTNKECTISNMAGQQWSWGDARRLGRPDCCTAGVELNRRLNRQAMVASSAEPRGPLRNVGEHHIYALNNRTPTAESQQDLDLLCSDCTIVEDPLDRDLSTRAPGRDTPPQ